MLLGSLRNNKENPVLFFLLITIFKPILL
jgi:hypothetical protein